MAVDSSATLQVLSNTLSISVIAACIIIKVPQIYSMIRGRSSDGVSLSSVLLEECGYSIMLAYHFAMDYPLSTYFEYTFLVIQDLIVIMLILNYTNRISISTLPLFAFLCTPISVGSKLIQLISIVRTQDPGAVSATTWGMAFYTTMARSITTMIETGDLWVLMNFGISCSLNLSLTLLVTYYRQSSKKKLY